MEYPLCTEREELSARYGLKRSFRSAHSCPNFSDQPETEPKLPERNILSAAFLLVFRGAAL
ncbi:hypothetical protein [Marivita sp. S0852]|uniref:hypothetical protein n=1 Tax=Marivita sp. S0852 TaxID=3373893 RepID=UPI003981F286